ncbi:BTAD domain-containing putative transcriptional regulator [Streptomyces sp. NBC_00083]|uniref:BTAD domain-containing putative transcriptional regulator n=1 Tax=Streptomyces sp. NBC_00083 TaxID=2975647 RepID=UPI002255722B|nr:BTAD domain-containing putative transcriptional regulator [Streptomyces sp. NBC_00083]MCX5387495.1 AAA family ATPase [Streptomyces sp. NBC_00083]
MDEGRTVVLGGTKQRATLGFLLLQANKVVATSQLLNALWGVDDAPVTARKILQNAVYGLRGALTPGRGAGAQAPTARAALLTQPPGYVMRVDPEQVDLHLFHTWVGQGRDRLASGAPEAAAPLLRDALALWRGPALADLVETGVEWPELVAVQNTRLDVLEDYFEAQLACGRHHEVLAELETMVRAEPLRERSCGQLMLALYRCGRQADALTVFSRVRAVLVESLGLEPGQALQRLQQLILTQDPALALDRAREPQAPLTSHRSPAADAISAGTPADTGAAAGGRRPAAGTRGPAPAPGPAAATAERPVGVERRQVGVLCVRHRLAPSLGGTDQEHVDLLAGAALLVREQVERHGGTVTATIGSVCLALFGLDGRRDAPHQAVLAALAIRDVLDVPAQSGADTDRSTVHAAVTMGEVLLRACDRGGPPTVIGAVLDESQALLSGVPASEVRVSDAVRRASEHGIDYLRCADPAGSWQALGLRSLGADEPDSAERSVELDVLRGLMKRTLQRAVPHLVTVLGEAGTGKSRLLTDFGRWAAARPDAPLVLTADVPEDGAASPLLVAGRLLASYCGIRPGADEATAQSALEREVRALYPSEETAHLRLERLRPLVALSGVEAAFGEMCPGEVLDAWREFFQEAAQRRPLVLCVDDLHHATDMALDAVGELAESAGAGPLFVVACAGPELLALRPSWAGGKSRVTTVTLDRPERITNEQLVEFLLLAARSQGSQNVAG